MNLISASNRSIVVDHLKNARNSDIGVAFAFFDFTQRSSQTPAAIFGSFLNQLAENKMSIRKELENLYRKNIMRESRHLLPQIFEELKSAIDNYSKVFLILDGLDELSEENQNKVVTELQKLLNRQADAKVKLMVTSRPHLKTIKNNFCDACELKIEASDQDVRIYLASRIPDAVPFSQPELRAKIIDEITRKTQGM